jgi:predicted aminopeptidase
MSEKIDKWVIKNMAATQAFSPYFLFLFVRASGLWPEFYLSFRVCCVSVSIGV